MRRKLFESHVFRAGREPATHEHTNVWGHGIVLLHTTHTHTPEAIGTIRVGKAAPHKGATVPSIVPFLHSFELPSDSLGKGTEASGFSQAAPARSSFIYH